MSLTTTLPRRESKVLLATGLAILAAASFGEAVYAFQTAAQAQAFTLLGVTVPTDALLKTVVAVGAGIYGALGVPVSIALLQRGGAKYEHQARVGLALAAAAILISIGNLSGYFAHTRTQAVAEMTETSATYRQAAAKMARGERLYRSELEAMERAERTPTPERNIGDVFKAALVYVLIVTCGAAYRLPAERGGKRRTKRQATQPVKRTRRSRPRVAANDDNVERLPLFNRA